MRKEVKIPTIIAYLYLLIMIFININKGNLEFIGYAVVIGILYYALIKLDNKYQFPTYSIWMFTIWIILHFLGGTLHIGTTRLYDYVIIPIINGGGELLILKYDQIMHTYTYITIAILCYHALTKHMKKTKALMIFAALAAMGIGGLNEIIEFAMVLYADAAKEVGGYTNTALDIVFNTIGAIIGVIIANKK